MPQFFKGDSTEKKFYNSAKPGSDSLELQKDEFFDGAYDCFVLGDVLYETKRAPLTNAISQEIFRESFATVFNAFLEAGSFESYLTVFRKIFGEEVEVTFTVPGPGKLNIDITAEGVVLTNFAAREIVDNTYVYHDILDDEGENIVFQTIKGFESQYELEKMLFEMVPDGIYTEITLTLGG